MAIIKNKRKGIYRRANLLVLSQLVGFGFLTARLFNLQIQQKERFGKLADQNRIKTQLIPPLRGIIKDSNGEIIAGSRQLFRVFLTKTTQKNFISNLQKLRSLIDINDKKYRYIINSARTKKKGTSILIKEDIKWDEIAIVSYNLPYINDIQIIRGETRTYNKAKSISNIIGYVGRISDKDLKKFGDLPVFHIPGFQIGKSGVEKRKENRLRGLPGSRRIEVNAFGSEQKILEETQPMAGKEVRLTINAKLQEYISKILSKHHSASVVVIENQTGAIKALVSEPTIDNNLFVRGISEDKWKEIQENIYHPLLNKPIQGLYAPGSIFKLITAIAALESGIKTSELIFCPGYFSYGRDQHKFHCWKKEGHQITNLHKAIVESCDVWFYAMAERIGIDKIYEVAEKFGLGKKHDIGLDNENPGILPNSSWKKKYRNERWYVTDTIVTSIGQGLLLNNPLQLAILTAYIANDGVKIRPTIYKDEILKNIKNSQKIDVQESHIKFIKHAMFETVNYRKGTAFASRTYNWKSAGKTGTSQVRRISIEERTQGVLKNKDIDWETRDHALFVGYAPSDKPKYSVSVVIEHGGSGSSSAAPIYKKIINKLMELEK